MSRSVRWFQVLIVSARKGPSACRARWQPMLIAALALTLASPPVGHAQQPINAQPVTAQSIALTPAEIGPEWTTSRQGARTVDGTEVFEAVYMTPTGRTLRVTTAVARSAELAEAIISFLRYELQDEGATIVSVQDQGFGDGRAFKAQGTDGKTMLVSYLFRVRNLLTAVDYQGAASANDVQSQAVALARKQEAKLFATFAPPTQPTPTALPTAVPTPAPTSIPTPAPVVASAAVAAPAGEPYCRAGEQPQFRFGFAGLQAQLGPRMGSPTSCEYDDPAGSGDTLQNTSTGLGIYRLRTNTPTFTTGFEHWAITSAGMVYWTGDSIDPPPPASDLQP
jgi:hypothetical protein